MLLGKDCVFLDLETTGSRPSSDGITEVGLRRVSPDGETLVWQRLINPGRSIPDFIQQLTGIRPDMLQDAPFFEDIAEELWQQLEGAVLVAHNVRFDYGFLRQAFKAVGKDYRPAMCCTVKLSRKLYPQSSGHSLNAICSRMGVRRDVAHRAMADVDAMFAFVCQAVADHGLSAVNDCLRNQNRRPSLPPGLSDADLSSLPASPGVYHFYGQESQLLYVGKSVDIRKRVGSHFSADHKSHKEMQMAQSVVRIEYEETAGELGALLLENQQIKRLSPIFNRRQRRYKSLWTIELRAGLDNYLQPVIVNQPMQDWVQERELFGLFRNRSQAKKFLEEQLRSEKICKKVSGLESGKGPCFGRQIGQCKGACEGDESAQIHNLRLQLALQSQQIRSWPYEGSVVAVESGRHGRRECHLIRHWCHLASWPDDQWPELEVLPMQAQFDIETYRILLKHLPKLDVRPLSSL